MSSFLDYTVNGLVIGNIYALLAVGLALIFGVANLINFAHGSVYTIGAYVGWAAITFLHTPLPVTMAIVFVGQGIASLQEAAVVPTTFLNYAPTVPMLGLYPTIQSLGAQALLLIFAVAAVFVPRKTAARQVRVAEQAAMQPARRA